MINIALTDIPEDAFSQHAVKSYNMGSQLIISLSGATLRDRVLSQAQIKIIDWHFKSVFKQIGRNSEKICGPHTDPFGRTRQGKEEKHLQRLATPFLPKVRLGPIDLSIFEQYGEKPEQVYSPFLMPKRIMKFQILGSNLQLIDKGEVDLILWFFRLATVEVWGCVD